jgi:hypothetical protein
VWWMHLLLRGEMSPITISTSHVMGFMTVLVPLLALLHLPLPSLLSEIAAPLVTSFFRQQ